MGVSGAVSMFIFKATYVHTYVHIAVYMCVISLYYCTYVCTYVCVFCTVWPSHCLFHVVSDCFWNYTYMYVHTYSLFYVRICFWVCSTPGMSPSAHLLEFLFEIITSKWVMLAVTAVITVLTYVVDCYIVIASELILMPF